MSKLLKGKKALLIAEGCKINKETKLMSARLAEIKTELAIKKAGTYSNEAGDSLIVTESENFSPISPKKVMTYLKKQKMISEFPGTVKVQIGALKKVVPQTVFEKWRNSLDSSLKFSWK